MKIFFVNDSSSNPNWGDRAAAISLKRMMIASGGVLHQILTEDDLREGRLNFETVHSANHKKSVRTFWDWMTLILPPILPKLARKLHDALRRQNEFPCIPMSVKELETCANAIMHDHAHFGELLGGIEQSDVMLVHGNGCMVGNGILPRSELFLCYLAKTRFKKPALLLNHTADLSHPDLNAMAEVVYPLLDDVTYRDRTSLQLCADRWPGRYAADSAFFFKPLEKKVWSNFASRPTYFDVWPDEAIFDPKLPYICVGGSSFYSFNGPPMDIVKDFIGLISHLQRVYPGQIVLTASDLKDQIIFRPVAKALKLPLIGLMTPVQQAVDIVGNAQAYIGGRWHPSIFALRGGAPVVPLESKTFKIQSLVKMAGLPVSTFNAMHLSQEKEGIGDALNALVDHGEKLRSFLRQWAEDESTTIWEHMTFLRSWRSKRGQE